MKKMNLFTRIMIAAAVVMCGVACDDNDNEENLLLPESVGGAYDGYTLSSCEYFSDTCTGGETIVVTDNGDGTADLSFASSMWGDFRIVGAAVSVQNGVYMLAGSGTTEMGMQTVKSYDCTVSGTVRSAADASFVFEVPAVMGGLEIAFATGDAPAVLLLPGSYDGYTSAGCAYFQNDYTDDQSLTISAADGTLSLVFASSMGTFEVAALTAEATQGVYAVSGSGTVAMGMGASATDYAFTLTGTVNAAKDRYDFVFEVPAVMGGLKIELLPGTAPTE